MGHRSHLGNRQRGSQAPYPSEATRVGGDSSGFSQTNTSASCFFHLKIYVSPLCTQIWRIPANWKHGARTKSLFCLEGNKIKKGFFFQAIRKELLTLSAQADIFMRKRIWTISFTACKYWMTRRAKQYFHICLPSSPLPTDVNSPLPFSLQGVPITFFYLFIWGNLETEYCVYLPCVFGQCQ